MSELHGQAQRMMGTWRIASDASVMGEQTVAEPEFARPWFDLEPHGRACRPCSGSASPTSFGTGHPNDAAPYGPRRGPPGGDDFPPPPPRDPPPAGPLGPLRFYPNAPPAIVPPRTWDGDAEPPILEWEPQPLAWEPQPRRGELDWETRPLDVDWAMYPPFQQRWVTCSQQYEEDRRKDCFIEPAGPEICPGPSGRPRTVPRVLSFSDPGNPAYAGAVADLFKPNGFDVEDDPEGPDKLRFVRTAWALVVDNIDLVEWAACLLDGDRARRSDALKNCLSRKFVDPRRPVMVHNGLGRMCEDGKGGAWARMPILSPGLPGVSFAGEISLCLNRTFDTDPDDPDGPADVVRPGERFRRWWEHDNKCVVASTAANLVHEMVHVCGRSPNDKRGSCDASYIVGNTFRWALSKRYPALCESIDRCMFFKD